MTLTVILPVFLLILVGLALRRGGLFEESFWLSAERLAYFVLLPCLLVAICAGADLGNTHYLGLAGAIAGGMAIVTGLCLALRPAIGGDGARFTSVVQGAIRFNGYVGLAIAAGLYGDAGLAAAAIAVLTIVLCGNVISVVVLSTFGARASSKPAPGVLGVLRQCASNPLIVACAIGLLINLSGLGLPDVIAGLLDLIGRAALPIGLLAVGAGLRFELGNGQSRALAVSTALKLAVLPLVTLALAWAFGIGGTPLVIAVLFNALPTASSSYILARQMGGDAPLMATIITAQTLFALITLPVTLTLLR